MKPKKIILTVYLIVYSCLAYAQRIDVQHTFVATTEEEVYKLYDQIADSVRLSNRFAVHDFSSFAITPFFEFFELESKDTLMKFEQYCSRTIFNEYICNRLYNSRISNSMSIDFYKRFLNYLQELGTSDDYYVRDVAHVPLLGIRNILIKQYESGKLNEIDRLKALELIEMVTLRMINEAHSYLRYYKDEYMTDNIKQALINVIETPFYPAEYLDFFISKQDTTFLDTTGISYNIKEMAITGRHFNIPEENLEDYWRFRDFIFYKKIGEELGGLSPGQAYLNRRKDMFSFKGYLNINNIAEYAYQKNDEVLIRHLKEFKIKHPDYPLNHF